MSKNRSVRFGFGGATVLLASRGSVVSFNTTVRKVRVSVRVSVTTSRILISPIEKDPMLFLRSQNFLPKTAMHF